MFETIAGALLPAIVTILLGYVAARRHEFKAGDARTLNRMVLDCALPLALFLGMVGTDRAALLRDVPLLIALSAAIVGLYVAVLLVCRVALRLPLGMSALCALAASAPNGPFVGAVVLGHLYGTVSDVVVAICGVLLYLTVVPATVVLLSLDAGRTAPRPAGGPARAAGPSSGSTAPPRVSVLGDVADAIKQPVVWLPLLGFVIVLLGVTVPKLAADSLALLGQSASGVALFSSGVVLAGYRVTVSGRVLFLVFVKNVLQPALVWGGLLLAGYSRLLLGEAVVTAALPMLVLVVMFSVQYQVGEEEMASAMFISTVASLVTTSAFIGLTRG